MQIFVTVGTTRFDELVNAVLAPEFKSSAQLAGYTRVIVQYGHSHIPQVDDASFYSLFQFQHSISRLIKESDLIITHGGSGTILECLHNRKPFIVVVNCSLMDNHQAELANKLSAQGYCGLCSFDDLSECFGLVKFKEYEIGNPRLLLQVLPK